MGLREDVLRQLVTGYQQTRDCVTFSRILKRVDKLLLSVIRKHVRRRPHLQRIDLRDLYHSAIVGMGRAILTAKDNESGNKIIARIIAYVKAALNKDYPLNTKRQFSKFVSLEDCVDYPTITDRIIQSQEMIELNVELSLLRDEYVGMLFYNYISEEDLMLLHMRYGQKMYYKEIAAVIHVSEQYARERVLKILKRFQAWFEGYEV